MAQHTRIIALVLAVLTAATCSPLASAQGTFGALPDPISSRDLNRYADRMGLSDQQMLAIGEPHTRYLEQFRMLREGEMQALMDRVRGMRMRFDPAQFSQMATVLNDFNRLLGRIRTLDEQFFGEMQALLTVEQAEMMPRLRQQRERARYMSEATRFTEFINPAVRLDLSEMILQLDLPPDQLEMIDPLLAQYEMRLTTNARRVFDASIKMFSDGIKRFEELGFTEDVMNDRAQMMRMFAAVQELWTELSVDMLKEANTLTNLHRSTFRQLALMLPEDSSRLLRERYYSRAYPQAATIGRNAEAHYAAALELESLPDDLHSSIAAMAQAHMASQDRLAEQVVDLIEERRRNLSLMQIANMGDDTTQQRIEEITSRAEAADATAIETLKNILGPEVASQLQPVPMTTVRRDRIAAMRGERGMQVRAGRGDAGRRMGGMQGGTWMMGRSSVDFLAEIRPPDRINASDLLDYAQRLNLSTSQQAILESLHEDYLDRFETIRREYALPYAQIVQQLRNDEDLSPEARSEVLIEGLTLLEQLLHAVSEEDERFFADVRIAVIDSSSDEQQDGLRTLELTRERQRYQLPAPRGGGMAGFGGPAAEGHIDLASLLSSLEIDASEAHELTPTVSQYTMNAAGLLRRRFQSELAIHRSTAEMIAMRVGGPDRDEARQRMRDMARAMEEVRSAANEVYESLRSLNRETLASLYETLSDSAATQLDDLYHRQAYPQVFDDPESAETVLQAAFALGDLAESQRSRLFEIAADFRPVYHELNQRILDHHVALAEMPRPGGRMARGGEGGRPNWADRAERMNALGLLNFDRTELNERTMRELRAVLSPAQLEQVSQSSPGPRDQARR